jgi:hypothetical protein
MGLKTAYLLLASLLVAVIALLYGISPSWFARTFLSANDLGLDGSHILRAVMCLYLAFAGLWLYSAFHAEYRNFAILSTMVFGGGLVAGRILSLLVDGIPSPLLLFYTLLEFVLLPVAYWVLRRPESVVRS